MIVTKFCNQVLGIACVVLSLGASPAGFYTHSSSVNNRASTESESTTKKPNSPRVELVPHGCDLDPSMQNKIHRGIQFQYDFYAQYLGYQFSKDVIVRIRIFKDADAYRSFIDANYPHIPKTWIGVYLSGVNEILVSREKDEDAFYKNIFHETSHLLLTDRVKNCPNWLNEGLAEYFEFMNVNGDEVTIHPQVTKDSRIKSWSDNQRLPNLLSSISMTNKEWNFNDNISESDEPRTLGWSVAYFLMSTSKGRECIKNLLTYLSRNTHDTYASIKALNEYYPGGTRTLVHEWQEWVPQVHTKHSYLLNTQDEQSQTAHVSN